MLLTAEYFVLDESCPTFGQTVWPSHLEPLNFLEFFGWFYRGFIYIEFRKVGCN